LTVILRPPVCGGALAAVGVVVSVVVEDETEALGVAPELFTGGGVAGGLLTAT
jgi:hypothetical protein